MACSWFLLSREPRHRERTTAHSGFVGRLVSEAAQVSDGSAGVVVVVVAGGDAVECKENAVAADGVGLAATGS